MPRFFILFVWLSAFVLTSCNYTEEITFHPDGSGEFLMSYDMSEAMTSIKKIGGNEEAYKKEEKVDSIIYFKDILKEQADSISKLPQDEQDNLKSLESMMMRVQSNYETEVFNLGFGSVFKSITEFPEILKNIGKAKAFNARGSTEFSKMDRSEVAKSVNNMLKHLQFAFDGKQFSRTLKAGYEPSAEALAKLNEEMKMMGEEEETLKAMTYTLVYHFPKEIKSVSNTHALISEDRKTVTLEQNYIDMIKNSELMILKVVLKD
ncbi:conserved hypothetical protein [Formosa agariphila KMM 3901]|uniref:Lipoprotein n=1 Tax=Formosa agariphila (strain DSM 15362 / KCTC 12365 / LMG 23005 / KMM 3901 / M-2Alg 35-1) TaxID=1347342 RepID=T2KP47_FORAG|nr:hypothetical protein [Formosa agariphila]CDF80520.1 conserved hypothetical protein [Formosa agariphila KMM 3901]